MQMILREIFKIYPFVLPGLLVYIIFFWSSKEPPSKLKFVGQMEFAIGFVVYLAVGVIPVALEIRLSPSFTLVGFLYGVASMIIGIGLMSGNPIARKSCIAISIIRLFTIIGTIPSIVSLRALCTDNSVRNFFRLDKKQIKKS
ncbi:hypothetical protein STSP2_00198 [Anaerohalosphaera lusitana]|uniref:Uncharacterized protein n=1 Tax=Anaerohalosphaera lusitana TaxID=1936003 RepID=A0A1U9NH27_9BACT|nr:hypothetical protein [Anaerohalosphaera lusitana]AQT67058.1 hypothetical protein STSP2_00198 [Anaerohalosphaera lusitana]